MELAKLTERDDLEGLSLVPQLQDATAKRERPAITSHNQGNHGIRSERWRYIQYADGSEELYDMISDPNEWKNIVNLPEMASVVAQHKKWLPKIDSPPAAGSASRVLTRTIIRTARSLVLYVSLSRLTIAFGNVSLERLTYNRLKYKTERYFETVP